MSTLEAPEHQRGHNSSDDVRQEKRSLGDTATCEYCGITGPRDNFYSTSKRFCSATCSHSFSAWHRTKNSSKNFPGKVKKLSNRGKSLTLQLPSEMERQQSIGFDWGSYINRQQADAAGVNLFLHAAMSSYWGEVNIGMKVEVLNLDCNLNTKVFWIAQVVQVAGYKAKLRYEGFGDDESCDFWCNLCTLDVHAVGWCATIGKPLVPPQTIQYKYANWKSFLVKRLTGAKTLPNDFHKRVVESMECPFLCSMRIEVVDKTQISRMRIGIIDDIAGGRLRLRYEDSDDLNDDFWCHAGSPLIHWVGWCEKVGHRILVASKDYKTKKGYKNAKQELFAQVRQVKSCGFKAGMKLEAIDPLNLSAVCVATVKKVLKSGYLMIGIDGSEAANGSDWFCYHCTSPSIFPVGFCVANHIALSTPKGYKDNFSWTSYLKEKNSPAAPVELFDSDLPDHGFKPGMKLEAVDLMEPRLICVATVEKVVGRLLHVHFDGWESEYDQWVDCQSPDIYPVGWCELVGYELQPPPNTQVLDSAAKKKKLKGRSFVVKKKRKKIPLVSKKDSTATESEKQPMVTGQAHGEAVFTPTERKLADNTSAATPVTASDVNLSHEQTPAVDNSQSETELPSKEDSIKVPVTDSVIEGSQLEAESAEPAVSEKTESANFDQGELVLSGDHDEGDSERKEVEKSSEPMDDNIVTELGKVSAMDS